MSDLSDYLQELLKTDSYFKNIPTRILSDTSVPGEGEHKILGLNEDIKEEDKTNETVSIIWTDADFIMLSMASKYKNIYLLRESVHFGKVQDESFGYLDIPTLKHIYMK